MEEPETTANFASESNSNVRIIFNKMVCDKVDNSHVGKIEHRYDFCFKKEVWQVWI